MRPAHHRRTATTISISILFAAACTLETACAVGPRYTRPPVSLPTSFKEQAAAASAGEWKRAEPHDAALRGRWWEIFGDPELSALEERVSVSNQSIALADAQFRGARAAARGARADLFPTVSAAASATRFGASANRSSLSGPAVPAPGGSPGASSVETSRVTTVYELPIDASYEVDVWGRVRRTIEAGVANAQATAADLEAMRLAMHAELAIDYVDLRGLEAEKSLLDSTVAAYEKALQVTTNRHDQGVASGVDVAQAQAQLDAARVQATDIALSRAQLEHAMAVLVGEAPSDFAVAPARNAITPRTSAAVTPPAIPVALPSELVERRPDVAAAERRVASANASIGAAKAAYFPKLMLEASGGYEASNLASWFSMPIRFWSVGAALAETLFDAGRRRAATEQAQAVYDANVAAYREDVLTAFQEVEDNLAAIRDLADEARQQDGAVAASERALTLANDRYQAGITSYLEVVTAQSTALSEERSAVQILTRRMAASVLLIKALGGGWRPSDLPAADALTSRKGAPADRDTLDDGRTPEQSSADSP